MFTDMRRNRIETNDDTAIKPVAWKVTFTDLIMLITSFFIMVFTMSSINQKSLKDTFNYYKKAIDGSAHSGYKRYAAYGNIKAALKNISSSIDIKEDERGIVLSIHENMLFEPGKSTIKKENYRILDCIADAIDSCSNEIIVMGHTDDLPVQVGEYESNWEMSIYKGLSVLDYFVKNKNMPPSRFHAGGYGAFRPLFPNNSSKNRSLNRRVEIIFKHKEV